MKPLSVIKSMVLPLALLLSAQAFGWGDENTAVLAVAQAKQDQDTVINGVDVSLVYVGKQGDCDAVGAMWPQDRITNYRVCQGQVQERSGPPPAWADNPDSRVVLQSAVEGGLRYGHASQAYGDYTISTQQLAASGLCQNVEVVISFQGDLVGRAFKQVCQ